MDSDNHWSRTLTPIGLVATLFGAIDPLEGAFLVLFGSGLVALGFFLNQAERRLVVFRVWVFGLVVVGCAALWGLSTVGGIGGSSGRSEWWGALTLPYLLGWSMSLWGPGSPRWILWPGVAAGVWYLTLAGVVLWTFWGPGAAMSVVPGLVVGAVGVLTIAGCASRLRKSRSRHA